MHPKITIARGTLTHLLNLVSVDEAQVATFGGQGIEADVWTEVGIKPENGWLIERSKKAQKALMDRHPFQISCSNLSRFPNGFHEKRGTDAGLDLFHWDLSGTVDGASRELPSILPLLIQGKGKLLGVTYADSRGNASLTEHEMMKKVGQRVFGEATFDLLLQSLVDLYRCEPIDGTDESFVTSAASREKRSQNTALREIGALLHLLFACASIPRSETHSSLQTPIEALHDVICKKIDLRQFMRVLKRTRLSVNLELVEKFVYISKYSQYAKRMRHFLFRLVSREQSDALLTELAPGFASLLMTRTCRYLHGETDVMFTRDDRKEEEEMDRTPRTQAESDAPASESESTATRSNKRETEVVKLMEVIGPVATAIGGNFLKSITRLEELARLPETIRPAVLDQIRELLDRADSVPAKIAVLPQATPRTSAPTTSATQPTRRGKRGNSDSLSLEVKDRIRIAIIDVVVAARLEKKNPAEIDQVRQGAIQKIAAEHGLDRAANCTNIFGGILARGNGAHRPGFLKRVFDKITAKKERSDLLKKLAAYWEVPVSELEAEIDSASAASPG